MVYTVGEMARLLDVSASTLRYYDKEGLLPFVECSSGADAFCRNPPWRALESKIPPIRLKKLIVVTGFTVRIWIWLLNQEKSVEYHARLIFMYGELPERTGLRRMERARAQPAFTNLYNKSAFP